jgi:hypothetical protein
MEQNVNAELKQIAQELRHIISDMERISDGVRSGFCGIGSEYCAAALDRVIEEYRTTEKLLEQLKVNSPASVQNTSKPAQPASKTTQTATGSTGNFLLDYLG